MLRPLTLLATAALLSLTAPATAKTDQLLSLVEMELPFYAPGVDARSLSRAQLASIYSILHGSKSGGDKRALIRSVIGGPYSLRGLLFN
jgi:hypothetical protein